MELGLEFLLWSWYKALLLHGLIVYHHWHHFVRNFRLKVTSFLQQHCNNEQKFKKRAFTFLKLLLLKKLSFYSMWAASEMHKSIRNIRFHLNMFEFEANYAETSIKVHKYGAYSHVACSLNPFQDYFNFYTAMSRTFRFETENLTWNQV